MTETVISEVKMQAQYCYIIDAKRTPIGAFQGALSFLSSPQLGSAAISSLIENNDISSNDIDEVIMGCVLSAGLGQAPARQAAIHAGLNYDTACTTVNKMCGSGMKALMMACDSILASQANLVIAGGMESMSNAPYLLPKVREGLRISHHKVIDSMFFDGLEDAYDRGQLMGVFAEDCASKYDFSREAQDNFALNSLNKALSAQNNAYFADEIIPLNIDEQLIEKDETPGKVKPEKISKLRPAFKKDGTVTAASSSSISDGASAILVASEQIIKQKNIKPLAKVIAYASAAQAPEWFTTAPIKAIANVLEKAKWQKDDVDLYEINEAFAVVTMAAMEELKLDEKKVNIHGGACVLGHPIGASGARIITTLIYALRRNGLKRGIASLCIGGGEATAIAIELV